MKSIFENKPIIENNTSELNELKKSNARLKALVKQRTKKLTEVGEANSKFISIIAHDLRGPFSSVLVALELLKKNLASTKKNDRELLINIAVDSVSCALNLLDSLLAWSFSQNQGNSFKAVKVDMDLLKLIREETQRFSRSALQKQIKVNYTVPPGLYIHADPEMIKTVVRNLLDNARKYTHSGGEINILASKNSQWIEITVKDTGVGMSEDVQNNLFKLTSTTKGTNGEKGVGLGLRLCKEIILLHGGLLRLESELGKGSTFIITLPIDDLKRNGQ